MENINPLEEILLWFTWGNLFFIAAVFALGWLTGVATFMCVLTKIID